jgi:hypothetical protein
MRSSLARAGAGAKAATANAVASAEEVSQREKDIVRTPNAPRVADGADDAPGRVNGIVIFAAACGAFRKGLA